MTSDRPMIVMSVYMPTNSSENLADFTDCLSTVSAIVEEYGVDSVFILGDYNANPYELFCNELITFCCEQRWSCIDIDILGIDSGTYTFISDAHGSCSWLDHCIVTQAARQSVVNVYVKYDTLWSDHFPLMIECNFNLLTPTKPHTIMINSNVIWGVRNDIQSSVFTNECHKRLKLIEFPSECVNCADFYCNDPCHWRTLDRLYADIVSALCEAAAISRGTPNKVRGGSRIMGWNRHVSEAHGRARVKFKQWVMCGKPKSGCMYIDMCESRRVFKSRLKWCQDNQDQIRMNALANQHCKSDFRGFWQNTNKLNARPGLPVSVEGVSDTKYIANIFKDHFSVHSSLDKVCGVHSADIPAETIGISYKAKDVFKIIKSMSRGKSPGHDGLSIEHLQHAGPHLSRVLAMFYSLCVSHSYLPSDFMKTVVVPVVKNKTGDLADKCNYRPISLATVIAKVFDGLLNTQLDKYVTVHDNQFGFRAQLSTESAILSMKHTVKYYTDRETPVYACFLDLSKAFDLVSYDLLWEKLNSINLPNELIKIFKYWYTHQINSVRWAGDMSEPYQLKCGVRQGGLTSPTLFNLYINELIVELSNQYIGCHIDGVSVNNLSYADDMVLLSASICGLRKLVQICEEYARRHGLRYNVTKSQCMIFEAGTKFTRSVPPVFLNGISLSWVDQFKYLGHWVTADLRDHDDMERERRALSKRANMIARRFARCTTEVKLTLFRAFCTSLYTCSLWANYTKKAYNALRVQYNNAFRAVLGLPRFCSASGMFAEARTACFHASMRKRAASLVRRVRASSNTVLAMIAGRLNCPYIRHCCDRHVACV